MSIKLVRPSKRLILCLPLLLLPSVFPSIRIFSNELPVHIRWLKYWSFSISPSNECSELISLRIDWFNFLCSLRDPQECSPAPQFPVLFPGLFSVSLLLICFIHSSLYFLIPYPCLAPPCFLLPTGNHWFVLCICESVCFVKYICFIFKDTTYK